jgi:hypothetical protein
VLIYHPSHGKRLTAYVDGIPEELVTRPAGDWSTLYFPCVLGVREAFNINAEPACLELHSAELS